MIAQYTAAALVNELQTLAHPRRVDTIPTSANQEDHVSMGATSALHLREVVDRTETVLAIEALCAAQGLDFRAPLRPGAGVARAHARLRALVPHLDEDRPPADDIAEVRELVCALWRAGIPMTELLFTLIDPDTFGDIPAPAAPGARCQTCDYWERLDGHRETEASEAARSLKLSRLMAGERLAGAYGMLAWQSGEDGDRLAVGWCQFGPISAYPRAQVIRDRYPDLPDSPAPWVVTCLQVVETQPDREEAAEALLTPSARTWIGAASLPSRPTPKRSPMRGCRRRGRHRSMSGQASPGWPARIDSR